MQPQPLVSPNEGRIVGHSPQTGDAALDLHITRLSDAVPGLQPLQARADILDGLHGVLDRHRMALIARIVLETAKTPAEATSEIDYALSFVTYARQRLAKHDFEVQTEPRRHIRKVGYGPSLLITPFNDPLAGILRKLAPSLAAGSPALVKPSPAAVSTALLLADLLTDAGLGDVIRIVSVSDADRVARLIDDARLQIVSFTGSTGVGQVVATRAAGAFKPAITELGGNNPFVVLADADLDLALKDLLSRKLRAAGQACSSVNRIYVHRSVAVAFADRLAAEANRLVLDRSDRPGVTLAPVISMNAIARLFGLVEASTLAGGVLLTAPPRRPPPDSPFLMPLSVIRTEAPDILDAQEAFGPVMSLTTFDREEDLLDRLSRESHALAAYIYTGDPARTAGALARLRFGSLGINTTDIQSASAPTGGFAQAGIGREGGPWGLDAFLTTINIVSR